MTAKLNPSAVLDDLTSRDPVRLDQLPRDHGIYALYDHAEAIRYIGITAKDPLGFFGRINNRHVTGSESRSHKFSHAYNTGRMWRAKEDGRQDAKTSKLLRTQFVRRFCKASFIPVREPLWGQLANLEVAVQKIAPTGMFDWGGERAFPAVKEPKELLDAFLDELAFSPAHRASIERQAGLFARGQIEGKQ